MKVKSLIAAMGAIAIFGPLVICVQTKAERLGAACPDSTDRIENIKTSLPSEAEVVSLIKKANLHEVGYLSKDLKSSCDQSSFGKDPFLKYGDYPDCVPVENPEIKILKILPQESETGSVTVIFDFIDKDAPQMGWISMQDYNKKICAMDFIFENGKWIVDNFYEAWNATIDTFEKKNAQSAKSN